LVKYFHIIQQFLKKELSYKTKSYHPFCIQNERNGYAGVRGKETMNLLGLILHIGL
jgi:hypothetical protein